MKKAISFLSVALFFASQLIGQVNNTLPDIRTFVDKEKEATIKHLSTNPQATYQKASTNFNHNRWSTAIPQWLDSVTEHNQDENIKYKYIYNQLDLLEIENVNYIFDEVEFPYLNIVYTYENDTLLKQKLLSGMNFPTFDWQEVFKSDFDYNVSNLLETMTTYEKEEFKADWTPLEKLSLTYDEYGNLKDITDKMYDTINLTWNNELFISYMYDDNQNLTEYIRQDWDAQASNWVNDEKQISTYNTLGLKTEMVEFDALGSSWTLAYKIEYTHNAQSQMTQQIRYTRNSTLNTWESSSKTESAFDDFGNLIESNIYTWNSTSLEWEIRDKFLRIYNSNYPFGDLVLPWNCFLFSYYWSSPIVPEPYYNFDMISPQFTSMLLSLTFQRWMESGSYWDTRKETEYYYSDHITSILESGSSAELKVYPNPASDYITIDWEDRGVQFDFELFNLLGTPVMSIDNATKRIEIKGITPGLYMYRIYNKDQEFKGKLLISE